jgi:serine/threonine-protein kinase
LAAENEHEPGVGAVGATPQRRQSMRQLEMNPVERRRARHGRVSLALRTALLVLASLLAGPFTARAQDGTQRTDTQRKAAAEVLFNEGQRLLYEHNYDAACRRFEQSQAADPGVGTLLYLAQCYDGQGRPASAWATYREAYSAAKAANQPDRAQVAEERATQLEPRLARLTVQVAPENPRDGFELAINGKSIDAALFGVAFPVDPGRYEVVARAFGRTPWSSSVDVQPVQQLTLQVPVLDAAREVQPLPGGDPYGSPAAGEGGIADSFSKLSQRQKAGIFVGAGGVTALAAGLVMGVVAKGKDDDAQKDCPNELCGSKDAVALNESARNWATGANIAYALGGIAIATGVALFFWPTKAPASTASALPLDISAQLGPRGGLLTIGGAL